MRRGVTAIVSFLLGSALLIASRDAAPDPPKVPVEPPPSVTTPVATVMAFLDTTPHENSGDNRSQALVIRSLHDQYAQRGIDIVIVEPVQADGTTTDARINARYDWGLTELTFVTDNDGRLAATYAVESFPTTLLTHPDGRPISVWRGYSSPGELGPILERLLASTPAGAG